MQVAGRARQSAGETVGGAERSRRPGSNEGTCDRSGSRAVLAFAIGVPISAMPP